jgi:hypothetical protein
MGKPLMRKRSIHYPHYQPDVVVCGHVRACLLGGSPDNPKPRTLFYRLYEASSVKPLFESNLNLRTQLQSLTSDFNFTIGEIE